MILSERVLSLADRAQAWASFLSHMSAVDALYGAMLMQMILYAPKIALIAVPLSIITLAISKTGIFDSSMAILISVFGSIIIGRFLMKTGWLDDQK